jgi:hypothetical protein
MYPIIGKSQILSAQIKQDHSNQNPNLTWPQLGLLIFIFFKKKNQDGLVLI